MVAEEVASWPGKRRQNNDVVSISDTFRAEHTRKSQTTKVYPRNVSATGAAANETVV